MSQEKPFRLDSLQGSQNKLGCFPFPGRCPGVPLDRPFRAPEFPGAFSRVCGILGFQACWFAPQRGTTSRSPGQRPRNATSTQKVRALKERPNPSPSLRPGCSLNQQSFDRGLSTFQQIQTRRRPARTTERIPNPNQTKGTSLPPTSPGGRFPPPGTNAPRRSRAPCK